jgi:hypothetical protein
MRSQTAKLNGAKWPGSATVSISLQSLEGLRYPCAYDESVTMYLPEIKTKSQTSNKFILFARGKVVGYYKPEGCGFESR